MIAFFGGFTFVNPPFNKDIYELFYPYFERAIKNNTEIENFNNQGIIRHIVAYYFWNLKI
jgi:hypothetical protein